jgi:hypothetical protein
LKFFNPNINNSPDKFAFESNGNSLARNHSEYSYGIEYGDKSSSKKTTAWKYSSTSNLDFILNNGPEGTYVSTNQLYYWKRRFQGWPAFPYTIIPPNNGLRIIPIRAWWAGVWDGSSSSSVLIENDSWFFLRDSTGDVIAKARPPYTDTFDIESSRGAWFYFVKPDLGRINGFGDIAKGLYVDATPNTSIQSIDFALSIDFLVLPALLEIND